MATVNKDFKIKSGLIVEGTTATINGFDALTKKQADQDYIVGLIGGTATSANEANKVVKRDANGNFAAGTITANITGDVTGTVSDISNHSTSSLSEGTNLYFTNQRAVTANTGLWDTIGAAAAAQSAAEATASADATSKANAAQAAAELTASNALTSAVNNLEDYADQAEVDAKAYTDTRETAITTAYQNYADAAETDAKAYTDTRETAITTAYRSYADQAELDAVATSNTYTDGKVADLVDSAPALLDTLNELAAAIADNPNYATDAAAAVAGRVAKSGDTMTGDLTLPGAPTLSLHAATKGYVDGEISGLDTAAQGYANDAEAAAIAHADALTTTDIAEGTNLYYTDGRARSAILPGTGLNLNVATGYIDANLGTGLNTDGSNNIKIDRTTVDGWYDASGAAQTAETNAIAHADALTTSDIAEGTSQYFTDVRAKTSAAALIVGATKTNITITGDENGLTISAENGVADSTTNDLTEGSTNKYFTAQRAVDALEAVVPNFTAVELNSVAKQVAATLSAPTAGIQVAHAFAKADYRSAEYLVKVAYGTHTEISKVLLTLDSSDNIAITEYGIVGTNGSASSISAGISGTDVQLLVTTSNNTSTVTVVGTLVA